MALLDLRLGLLKHVTNSVSKHLLVCSTVNVVDDDLVSIGGGDIMLCRLVKMNGLSFYRHSLNPEVVNGTNIICNPRSDQD